MSTDNIGTKISIWALIISIISIGISAVFSIKTCNFENRINKLHIDPTLSYYLVRSIDKKGLEFVLKNESPIPVVNLSVSLKSYDYSTKLNEYIAERPANSTIFDSPGENWIFKPKVNPNEPIGRKDTQIISMFEAYKEEAEMLSAIVFEITFYRESDMKQFHNKAIFFFNGEKIYSYQNALREEGLQQAIEKLPEFEQKIKSGRRKIIDRQKGGSRLYQKSE